MYLMLLGSLLGMLRRFTKERMCFQLFSSCQVGMRNIEAPTRFAFNDLQMQHAPVLSVFHPNGSQSAEVGLPRKSG